MYAAVFAVSFTLNDGTLTVVDPLPVCKTLFVVSQETLPLSVDEDVDNVNAGVLTIGDVNVLLVNVSEVARPTRVSVEVGRVKVPVLLIVEITGAVNVLF